MNRALAILVVCGVACVIAGNALYPGNWSLALTLFGGMMMGFCLGFYLAARTVRQILERR